VHSLLYRPNYKKEIYLRRKLEIAFKYKKNLKQYFNMKLNTTGV